MAISTFSSGERAIPGDCSPSLRVVSRIVILRFRTGCSLGLGRPRTYLSCASVGVKSNVVLAGVPGLPPVRVVEERGSTLEARRRYFADHPPRGWRRLVPLSLQVPPQEYDDYVAVLLIERAAGGMRQGGPGPGRPG